MKGQKEQTEIVIEKLMVGRVEVWLRGDTPQIHNCMSSKVKEGLLLPAGKKTAADKAQNLKHNVLEEYAGSMYKHRTPTATALAMPSTALKAAMCNAALEIPGTKKAQIGRLVWVEGTMCDVYGVPMLHMAVTRSADMNRTPDVRTRAILPEWCMCATIRFVMPTLNETAVARLLETAGLVIGLSDWRQQKGGGNYGQFHLSTKAECADIIKAGGRAAQEKAMENPECYDAETQALFDWYIAERKRRGK